MASGLERGVRKHLERIRQQGLLVDLSDQARRVHFGYRCEVSVPLYRSLLWRYPSAGERDTVDVCELLTELQSQWEIAGQQRKMFYYIRPPLRTWWMAPRYFLKLLVLYQRERIESVVILSEQEFPETLTATPGVVPASLLVPLLLSIGRLEMLSYRSERPLVRSLDVMVRELLRRSPLRVEILNFLDQRVPPVVPGGFSREEYREVTLRSLFEQLELTAAVADKLEADINLSVSGVLQLMANYVGFVPPSEDLALPGEKVQFH